MKNLIVSQNIRTKMIREPSENVTDVTEHSLFIFFSPIA